MRYADTLMSEGEVIVLRSRQHWLAIFLEARTAVVLWLAGLALLALVVFLNLRDMVAQVVSIAALVALAVGLVLFLYRLWQWWAQDYIVTNRRLMKVTGIFNKTSSDSSLEKINDAILHQNVLARILNYGDLDILTASESGLDYFRMLNSAKEFKRVMLNQKHALEMGMAYERPPSPPLRASPATMNGEPSPSAATRDDEATQPAAASTPTRTRRGPTFAGPMPSAGGPSEPEREQSASATADATRHAGRDESLEITQTLARLADLRDRGAIDSEEYEAKKEELLRRL